MFDTLLQDVRYALRALRSSPGFAAVAILSLALGIGANTAIFSLIDAVMLRSLPVSHPEQLLHVITDKNEYFSNPLWEQLRGRQDVFSAILAYDEVRVNLAARGEARFAQASYASGQFFETLGVRAIAGRTLATGDDYRGCPGVAVLSHSFWQKDFEGRRDVVGKSIPLDNHSFTVVGVLERGFAGLDVGNDRDLYLPLCAERIIRGENSNLDRRNGAWLKVIGRPKVGISAGKVEARLRTLSPAILEATVPANWKPEEQDSYRKSTFQTQTAVNGISFFRKQYQQSLMILMAIVGVVLLIACANVANLLLARGAVRQREVAIRIALGSGRGRLMRQLLTESLVLSLSGAAVGVLFARWSERLLVGFLTSERNRVFLDLSLDFRVVGFTVGGAIVTGLLFGLAPAWRATRVDPQSAMKANARGVIEGGRFGLGKALVVVQVALSLVLVMGAGLMVTTFFRLETSNPGFERDRVLVVNLDLRNGQYAAERRGGVYDEMLAHLRGLPVVRSASAAILTPISGVGAVDHVRVEGFTPKSRRDSLVYFNEVSDRYFETLGTKLLAGRDFSVYDTLQSPKVAIVNQAMARKFFHGANPIGRSYRTDEGPKAGKPVEIIGMVEDAKYGTLREDILPTAYIAASQDSAPGQSMVFVVRSAGGLPVSLMPAVRSSIAEVDPDVTMQFKTLALQVDESLSRERLLATLSGFFGGLALLLATIGLYGVMSFNVARRRNEIGIRIALGAEQARVLRMVLREVAVLIGLGIVAGFGLTVGLTRFVESFLFGIKATDPWVLSVAAGVLALVAAMAGFLPARRASRLDPMNALREE